MMRRSLPGLLLLGGLLVGCGADPAADTGSTATEGEATEPVEAEPVEAEPVEAEPVAATEPAGADACEASDCTACLALPGCNWTADRCASRCAMDTYCVGPGNPSAPVCTANVLILGSWQHDHAASSETEQVFVRSSVELGPARFRRSLTFRDGTEDSPPTMSTNVLADDDGHTTASGPWSVAGDRLTLRHGPSGAAEADMTVETFRIVSLDASTLRLASVE